MRQNIVLPTNFSINIKDEAGNKICRVNRKKINCDAEIEDLRINRNSVKLIRLSDGSEILVTKNKNIQTSYPDILFSPDLIVPKTKEELEANNRINWVKPAIQTINYHETNALNGLCSETLESWKDKFIFNEEEVLDNGNVKKGFRSAQIGALHAALGHWKVSNKPATIVMPTGTGKTETMLALFVHERLEKLLVVVPSDALRSQISEKFLELGWLNELGMLKDGDIKYPIVGILEHKPHTNENLLKLIESCNVVVSTIQILNSFDDSTQKLISEKFSNLFIDEAHHIPAPSWERFRSHFKEKTILQFTATPFRSDKRHVDGKIIYNFPLIKAQEQGYFKQIKFIALRVYDSHRVDEEIATRAVAQLDEDRQNDLNHVLMARADDIKRANEIFDIYRRIAPQYNPVIIHNKITGRDRVESFSRLKNGQSRIVVCVDMFGEGFDFPEFKIAAMHDVHKSLAITLQFTGRFVRSRNDIGDATVVANVAKKDVEDSLRELFSEDSDWNKILRTLSEGRTQREEQKSEFFEGFNNPPDDIPVDSLLPKMSTVVYKTTCTRWEPENITKLIKGSKLYCGPTINTQHSVAYFVTNEQENLEWTNIKEFTNIVWNLYIVHWDQASNFLYINSTNNKGHHQALAKAICGDSVVIFDGENIFRTLRGIKRLILMNLGLKHVFGKAVRFTMHAGMDVSGGISDVIVNNKIKSNLFGRGFENGNKASIGCSYKGRIWAYKVADSVDEWMGWCHQIGNKLNDSSINPDEILKSALVPEQATTRPDLFPLSIDWAEEVYINPEDIISFKYGEEIIPFYETSLSLINRSNSGPIQFEIRSNDKAVTYEIRFSDTGPQYFKISDQEIKVNIGSKTFSAEDWLKNFPLSIVFEDGSMLIGSQLYKFKNSSLTPYDKEKIETWDWAGVDLSKESQTVARLPDSIQFKVIEKQLEDNEKYDIVFDDDNSGEIADVVALKISGEKLLIDLFHCKYSHEDTPGARVADLYEVCGQAQKSVNWKCTVDKLLAHLRLREIKRINNGETSRFQKGDMILLDEIEAKLRFLIPELRVIIVQPGLSKQTVSNDQLKLIAATELYLLDTYSVSLKLIASS